ncbi:transthyretin-like family protein [Rossellomorea vietnamensis]|uniref:Transthyretin-like family protein n=1 Tax=Rossellomorea vietnamensis TaxID=218284 RepID=A0ACD4CD72_9BACI|nr:transthyretin-like family protein [Rossellomorea vietnamensis]UXH46189.1 transthyretin-like family protein [Rossellomorea vietnamensis]
MRKKASNASTQIFPPGCPGLFPRGICTNPTITLDNLGTISCDATISGKVRCDLRPLQGVTVNLTSPSDLLTFQNPNPVTNSRGEFSTTVIVDRNTPVTPNVSITARAVVVEETITDTITARVECLNCSNLIVTSPETVQAFASQLQAVTCPGIPIDGRVTCQGLPVPNVEIGFEVDSPSGKVIVTPNPTLTNNDGVYEATILPFPGALEIVTIVTTATIGGNTFRSEPVEYEINCPGCENLSITLDSPPQISCNGFLSGRLTCDGEPVANVPVALTGSSVLNIINPNPVTNENGEFTSLVTINFDTEGQEADYTASATFTGIEVTASGNVFVDCVRCNNPLLTLNQPLSPIGCDGGTITGQFTCNGEPIINTPVFFTVMSSGTVTVNPNPAITNADGIFNATIQPGLNVTETITIQASSMFGGEEVTSESRNASVNCVCENPVIELDNPGPISCRAVITGRVLCQGLPVPGVTVNLSSPLLNFETPNPVTGPDGSYSSVVTVQPITPVQEGVPYTAEAVVLGISASNTNFVRAECLVCDGQSLTLIPPAGSVGCDGAPLSGRVLCGNTPAQKVAVFFSVDPSIAFVSPNPAITDANGNYSAVITPNQGAIGPVELTATTAVAGNGITAGPFQVNLNCPVPPPECPCRFRLNTQGGAQPGARIRVVRFGHVEDYTGRLNITVVQCGSGIQGICNPAVDNFNFVFNASNGDNFQFTQGRRTSISCENNLTTAIVEGTINGRINNGPSRSFDAKITAVLNKINNTITWTLFATDNTTTTFETLVPFTAPTDPTSFIIGCP